MRCTKLLFASILATSTLSYGQLAENAYRNANNAHYWQNRKPTADYWQQDVAYKINARINEENHSIEGTETLKYWNNSPDTLTYVYFHLYQNAFIKGSYLHELELLNHVKPELGEQENKGLGIVLDNIMVNGTKANATLDNTLIKVMLNKPLLPGNTTEISMTFTTYWDKGATRRRMKMYDAWGSMHYNGCQWYPKLSVYDKMHGWDTYQHLNKEFYGDYGLFDVTLDFPSNYVVEASGVLENRKEVLPDTLRKKLDISNFAQKKWEEAPSIITPYTKGERKKWHFVANNVHDFAFTADPSYRIATTYWNGVECVGIVQEPHASGWQNSATYVASIIKTFSEEIGMYCYPKIVAADAADGMEYPMITLDGGSNPGYHGLLVHEIGHNWFYGQVGSNETYRAAMDEGFTQFLTSLGLRKLDGDTLPAPKYKSAYKNLFTEHNYVLDRNVLNSYTISALNQNEVSINTHSDDFHNALNHGGGYGAVYYKTASMLYNLEYVLGDSLFKQAMHHYFEQWKMAHPYFEDFRASIINYTHVDLSWFFDQWFETTKTIDYSIGRIRKIKGTDSFAVDFKRKSDMQMPLDFSVWDKQGNKHDYYIPNTWFTKQTSATVLPKWYGWGAFKPTYTAHISMPNGVKRVQIDTTYRLGDKMIADNYKTKGCTFNPGGILHKIDGGQLPTTDRRHYRMYWRPDAWYNAVDGIKVGAHVEGDYLNTLHKVNATVWFNTHLLQADRYLSFKNEAVYARYAPISYIVNYVSPISRKMPKLQMQLHSRSLDGLWYHRAGFNWLANDRNQVQLFMLAFWRPNDNALDYLLDTSNWSSDLKRPNNTLNAQWHHQYYYTKGQGKFALSLRAPLMNGNVFPFSYSYIQLESINQYSIGKLDIKSRVFGRLGMGTRVPNESYLYLSGASPEDQLENKYTRSQGFVPMDWQGTSMFNTNHYQMGGGLNLRGFAGYYTPDNRNGSILTSYKGRSGASINLEVDVDKYFSIRPKFTKNWLHVDVYGFADAGVMELSYYSGTDIYTLSPASKMSDLRMDAGIGTAFTIKKWGAFDKARPLTIRFDMPFFINRAPYSHPEYTAFRYVVGINRTF